MQIVTCFADRVSALRAELDEVIADGGFVAPSILDDLEGLLATEDAGLVVDLETGLIVDPLLSVGTVRYDAI